MGEGEAKAGNVKEAIATFKTALKWNPEIKFKFDPRKKAEEFENKGKAEVLRNEGESLARSSDIKNAVAKFHSALKLDPSLDIKPATTSLVSKASSLVSEKKIKEAIAAYNQAQKLDPQVEINADIA